MTDRADLARQRQLMRAKPASRVKTKKSSSKSKADGEAATDGPSDDRSTEATTKRASVTKRKSITAPTTANALGIANMALIVRQVLQCKHFGDPAEYLRKTSNGELFRLLTQVAQYAHELREQHRATAAKVEEVQRYMEQSNHDLTGRLIQTEAQLKESENQREQFAQRLQITSDEYRAVVDALRKSEEKWSTTQPTMAQQQQLLQQMSRSVNERTAQVDALSDELETLREAAAEVQQENTNLRNELQVGRIEGDRAQKQLADERRENKALLWDVQNKSRDHDDVADQLDETKNQIVTLEAQIQMELIARKSIVQERDAVQLLHRREREEWKKAEEARGEAERRKAHEFRNLDLEVRQVKQALGRLRTDLESERKQREKAEATALRATDMADELRAAGKTLQSDVHKLSSELQEERGARESKEGALTIAYRDLQSLQKRIREEESARHDAQNEVEALMHRMKLIRRDHFTLLHRVETPPQLVKRWSEPARAAPPSSSSGRSS